MKGEFFFMFDIKKNLFNELCSVYVKTRNIRHQMMEFAEIGKFDNGLYDHEIETVKMAYGILGFHEVTMETDGEVKVLIPDESIGHEVSFSIPTEDFIKIMEKGEDPYFRDAAWNALVKRDYESLQAVNM